MDSGKQLTMPDINMVTPSGALAIPSRANSMQNRRSVLQYGADASNVFVIGDHIPGPDKYMYGVPNFRDGSYSSWQSSDHGVVDNGRQVQDNQKASNHKGKNVSIHPQFCVGNKVENSPGVFCCSCPPSK